MKESKEFLPNEMPDVKQEENPVVMQEERKITENAQESPVVPDKADSEPVSLAKQEGEKKTENQVSDEKPLKKDENKPKKENKKKEKKRSELMRSFFDEKANIWMLLPLVLLLTVVPMIVFLKPLPLSPEEDAFWSSNGIVYDFFSYYKSTAIMGLSVVSLLFLFLFGNKKERKKDVLLTMSFVLMGIYLLFSLLSTVTSQYLQMSLWGAPDRREGFWVLLSYGIIFLFSIVSYRREKDRKVIFWSLFVLTLMTTVIGFLQFFGHDPLQTPMAKQFILPSNLRDANLTFQFEREKIYATMFHYNYIGSFGALLAPFFLTIALFSNKKSYGLISAFMTVCSLFVLFGSTSRAGVIGIILALLFFLIVFIRQLFLHFKVTLLGITIIAVVIAGFSMATGGAIFNRLPTLLEDLNVVSNTQSDFDYHDYIPIRQMNVKGKQLLLKLQNETMVIDHTTGVINIFDHAMDYITYEKDENSVYRTTDERFRDFSYRKGNVERTIDGKTDVVEVMVLNYQESNVLLLNLSDPSEIKFYTPKFYEFDPVDAPYIGFEGKEKIGSMRGYIWSRSLPLLKKTMIIGFGPDTFLVKFPQGDILAKWYAYGTTNMTVDKPHNWYLQVGINQGMIALVALLALLLLYIIDSLSLYMFRREYNDTEVFGIALLLGVIGYMGAGFFNDSVVSVAPIFWAMLGLGMGANYWVKKIRNEEKEMAKSE